MANKLETAWAEFLQTQAEELMPERASAAIEKLQQSWSQHQQEHLGAFMDGAQFYPSPLEKNVLEVLGKSARQERLDRKASYRTPMTPEEDEADLAMMEQLYQDRLKQTGR